jgi:Tol biopolymer transport system component
VQQTAKFCDTTHGYGEAFAVGRDGDLVVFSTTADSLGKSDLFLGDFTQTQTRSLKDFVPGINTAQDELGAAFWSAPAP